MKIHMFWLPALLLCFCSQLVSQNVIPVQASGIAGIYVVELNRPAGEFWALHLVREGGAPMSEVEFRWAHEGGSPEDWRPLLPAGHSPRQDVSEQIFIPAAYSRIAFRLPDGGFLAHLFDPGPSIAEPAPRPLSASEDDCIQPFALSRGDWCPNGDCPEISNPVMTVVTHLPVHHSAGTNSSSDWAAVVRAIWNFHVNTNGWSDVGYNYLIDPEGMIYVGRGEDVRGAHFCGNNTGTMGICLLGTFTNQTPSLAAIESLANLLAWKTSKNDIDPQLSSFHPPTGAIIPHIVPHQGGCGTACPGASFVPLFDALRQQVADTIASCMVSGTSAGGDLSAQLRVSPNPAKDWVAIAGAIEINASQNDLDWVLLDLFGRPVQTGKWTIQAGQVDQRIELGHLPAEVYILKISSQNQSGSYWIVKE